MRQESLQFFKKIQNLYKMTAKISKYSTEGVFVMMIN